MRPRVLMLQLLLVAGVLSPVGLAAARCLSGSNGGAMACYLVPPPDAVSEATLGQRGEFGASVAVTLDPASGGALCAVGAPTAMSAGSPRGSVRLVALDGRDGSLRPCSRIGQGVVAPQGLSAHARFGAAVDLSKGSTGTLLAVGAPGANSAGGSRAGLVRLYSVAGSSSPGPMPIAELVDFNPEPGSDGAAFGASVAFRGDGKQLAVGAPSATAPAGPSLAGAVYVYGCESGEWSLEFVATAPAPSVAATFGHAVGWVGDTLVVGSPGNGEIAPGAGRVYGLVGAGPQQGELRWELAAPKTTGGAAGMRYGESLVAVDGSTLAIGGWGRGVVEVFKVPASGDPVHRVLLRGDPTEGFGLRLAATPDRLFVGCPYAPGAGGESGAGRLKVFERSGSLWEPTGSLGSAEPSLNGEFGVALGAYTDGVNQAHVLVGEPGSNLACRTELGCAAGAAFLY